jgi:hypothetical protein
MASTPVQVHWFPKYNDKFITAGSEINLYQIKDFDENDAPSSKFVFMIIDDRCKEPAL